MSRQLILSMSVSLDGFVAGPNGELDWIFRNSTEASRAWAVERLGEVSLHAMGRVSYETMCDYWPIAESPFAEPMNRIPKVVFSRSGTISTPAFEKTRAAVDEGRVDQKVLDGWRAPQVLGKDLVVADIQRLKEDDGGPINALGGATFASSLVAAHLVDVFRLIVHPFILGDGLSVFRELEQPLHLKLEDVKAFDGGIVAKTYRPIYSETE